MNTPLIATSTKQTSLRRSLSLLKNASKTILRALPTTDSTFNTHPVIYYSDLRCQVITPKTSTFQSSYHQYLDCTIDTASPISFITRKVYNKHFSHLQLQFHQPFTLPGKYGIVCGEHVFTDLVIKGLDGKEDIKMFGRVWVVEENERSLKVVVGNDLLVPANAKIALGGGPDGRRHVLCVGDVKSLLGFRSCWPYTAFPTSRKVLDLDE